MINKQWELVALIEQLERLFAVPQSDKDEVNEEKRRLLAAIKVQIDAGVDLNFKPKTILERAVVTDSVELVEMFIAAGFPITEENGKMLLYYAAEVGAGEVVRFLIEEKGVDPGRRSKRDYPVLAAARLSRYSNNVLPYLVEVMQKTKSERVPAPKKPHELTEENMLKWLPQISIPEHKKKYFHNIIESIFIEEHSINLADFYYAIEAQDPEIIFACLELIKKAITLAPVNKTVETISGKTNIHHGDLAITSDQQIQSLMVTGDLTIAGQVTNGHGSQLFVGGNFECETMYTQGPVIIGGNLKAVTVHAYDNDSALEVKQTLQADKLITTERQVIAGRFEVKERIEKKDTANDETLA